MEDTLIIFKNIYLLVLGTLNAKLHEMKYVL